MKSRAFWVYKWGLALADFGRDPRSSNSLRGSRIFVFVFGQVSNARFHWFPVGQISRNLDTKRQSVSRWKLSEQNFDNFTAKGRFSLKTQQFSQNFQVLRLRAAITPPRLGLQIAGNSLPNSSSTGCLVIIFTVRINSKSFLSDVRSVQERYLLKFSATFDVRYCVLKPIHRSAAWRPIWKKSRLDWKLKISNADIPQSQVRDTRHRRMQEVNCLCTDSRPLRGEYCIVFIQHNTYSHLV